VHEIGCNLNFLDDRSEDRVRVSRRLDPGRQVKAIIVFRSRKLSKYDE
jgi:hypothetical protein